MKVSKGWLPEKKGHKCLLSLDSENMDNMINSITTLLGQ
jgi:hypothetical protein